jgi:hypothetical protein
VSEQIDIDAQFEHLMRCPCTRASIVRISIKHGDQLLPMGRGHVPDSANLDEYCFFWSTYELAVKVWNFVTWLPRRAWWRVHHWYFETFVRPRLFKAHPEEFKYDCAYCGRKTRQPPHEDEGRKYPSCCSATACIDQWRALEEESER